MTLEIPFNKAPVTGAEQEFIAQAISSASLAGLGRFSKRCEAWFENYLSCSRTLVTSSCTHALEIAAMLIEVGPGDEVIMPSFTFVSTANAFLLRGASVIFVDIDPDNMCLDVDQVEQAITPSTKAVVAVHYGGGSCDMQRLASFCGERDIFLIEDAAQAMTSQYFGKFLGTFGDIATFSFHETKNYTSGGEGGLLILNNERFVAAAEIIREKGTNRSLYFRGLVDKYSWVSLGSSYLMSEIQAAYLWGQLGYVDEIRDYRTNAWRRYESALRPLEKGSQIRIFRHHEGVSHNGHLFAVKARNIGERTRLITHLRDRGVLAVFHYVPLHSSSFGRANTVLRGKDNYTTTESERLVRLPLWYGISDSEIDRVSESVIEFFT